MIRITGVKIRELLVSEAGWHGSSFIPGQIWNLNVLYKKNKLKFFTFPTVPLFLFTLYLVVYTEKVSRLLRRIYNIVCYNLVVLSCRKKIRLIEGNANVINKKKLICKGTLRQVYLSEAQNPIYSHREEGEGESCTREKVRGATGHKAGSKIQIQIQIQIIYFLHFITVH
jgi:hypothetical protein